MTRAASTVAGIDIAKDKCDYSVERYIPSLIHAVQNGLFQPGHIGKRYGNYEIPEAMLKAAVG